MEHTENKDCTENKEQNKTENKEHTRNNEINQKTNKNTKKNDNKNVNKNKKNKKKDRPDPLFLEGVRLANKWTDQYVNERVVEKVDDDENNMVKIIEGILSVETKKNNFMLFSFDNKTKKDSEGEIIVSNKLLIGFKIENTAWFIYILGLLKDNNKDIEVSYLNDDKNYQIVVITNGSSLKDIDIVYNASILYLKENKLVDFGEEDEFIDYSEAVGVEW